MMQNRNSRQECRLSWHSVVNMKGRTYRDAPGSLGTQSLSTSTRALTASMNMSSGNTGMHRRRLELAMRLAFMSGRNSWILFSAVR